MRLEYRVWKGRWGWGWEVVEKDPHARHRVLREIDRGVGCATEKRARALACVVIHDEEQRKATKWEAA